MTEYWHRLLELMSPEKLLQGLRAAILIVVGLFVARFLGRLAVRLAGDRIERQRVFLLRRVVFYLVLVLFLVAALRQLGFQLGVLLGAAGIVSVAIGFASQTSASNVISGLFLIAEGPFKLGDVIQVGGTTGEVLSIDLLAVKIRTFDNIYVRIPNETLIKSEVRTLTRFPIRRVDVMVGVAYREDLARVREVLFDTAERNVLALDEPKPVFLLQGFGDSSINIQFSVWAKQERFVELKNSIHQDIKRAFDAAGIEIPFPQRSVSAGSGTAALPVRIVEGAAPEPGGSDGG